MEDIKVDYEKEIALYALRYAKDIIEFQQLILSGPKPPLGCINDAIRMITEGKFPWEQRQDCRGYVKIGGL